MSKVKKLLIGYPLVVFLTTLMCTIVFQIPTAYSLAANARSSTGIVKSKDRIQHRTIYFEYQVDGTSYTGAGGAEDAGLNFDTIEPGESVPITYDNSQHSSSVIGQPDKNLAAGLRLLVVQFVAVTSVFLFLILKNRRHSIGSGFHEST